MGQKQTCRYRFTMSALPPTTDIQRGKRHVRFVPKADIDGGPTTYATAAEMMQKAASF
jgi:hypothetical protein